MRGYRIELPPVDLTPKRSISYQQAIWCAPLTQPELAKEDLTGCYQ